MNKDEEGSITLTKDHVKRLKKFIAFSFITIAVLSSMATYTAIKISSIIPLMQHQLHQNK